MTTAASIMAELVLHSSGFTDGMRKSERAAESFESKMKSVGQKMQQVGAAMTLSLTLPIVALLTSAVKSAAESEAAIADLETVIKSTGGAAKVTSQAAQDLANSLQLVTKFSDEEIIKSEAMLLTFTKIGQDVFPDATKATLDMAQKFGMDASQAAITLGKALNDPIQGVTALRRIGVMLTDEQEKQIKAFMAVNDVASAQKVILNELAVEVGGAAEAFGATFAGKVAILKNQFDTLKEALGNAIIPTLVLFMQAITPIINAIASAPPWVQTLIVVFLALVAALGPLIGFVGTILSLAASLSTLGITAAAIGSAIAAFGSILLALLPVLLLIIATVALVILVWKNWETLTTTLSQLWFIFTYGIKKGITSISTGIKSLWTMFKSAFSGVGKAIDWVIAKWKLFEATIAKIKLPPALTPGSPTPFEMGLRGISSAMDNVSRKSLPKLNVGMDVAQAVTGVGNGGNVNITDNRRFSAGMDANALRVALDNKLNGLAGAL